LFVYKIQRADGKYLGSDGYKAWYFGPMGLTYYKKDCAEDCLARYTAYMGTSKGLRLVKYQLIEVVPKAVKAVAKIQRKKKLKRLLRMKKLLREKSSK